MPRRATLFAAVGIMVMLVVTLAALRVTRRDALPNLVLAGEPVGGMTRAELDSTVQTLAADDSGGMVTAQLQDRSRSASTATIGYEWDVDATADALWHRGRQINVLAALGDHLRATLGTVTAEPVTRVDEARLDRWVDGVVSALEIPPVEGNVRFKGTDVQRRDPRTGTRPNPQTVRSETLEVLANQAVGEARGDGSGPRTATLQFDTEPVEPRTTNEDVDRLVADAERIVSAPVELTRNGEALTLAPQTLARLYSVERPTARNGYRLALTISDGSLAEIFSEEVRKRFERKPKDATVVLTEGGPQVQDGRDGFLINLDMSREQIDTLARTAGDGAPRSAKLEGEVTEPERTTQEARDLNITQKVSSFTTEHACCQGRVTNIHRFADLMDGVLIEPDEVFSLNGHVGQRTADKGFVAGGAIQRGEYVEEVGGGVSQFATTFFNAAFFGGYEILEHKPHSYYISRYPMGRESTINYPTVDVKIHNNSPYGILVDTSYTGTSITVTFWAGKWVEVESTTGQPHNHTSPKTETRDNPDLEPGTKQVIQSGGNGFDVVVTRRLRYEDGTSDEEEYFTRYLAEPRIVERGPKGE
jgi:vancomycin resistance protein YoaR